MQEKTLISRGCKPPDAVQLILSGAKLFPSNAISINLAQVRGYRGVAKDDTMKDKN